MDILALDSATNACSAALWREGAVTAHRLEPAERGQAERLMPLVLEVLGEAGTEVAALDLLAVTRGPGSFTGLRVGLAAARGMALAAGIPCLGVTTLEAVAAGVEESVPGPLLVVLDAKRADVYAQAFDPSGQPLGEPGAVMPGELATLVAGDPVTLVGDAAKTAAEALAEAGRQVRLADAPGYPDARVIAAIAAGRWDGKAETPDPLYLRPPDARLPKAGGRLRP